MLLRSNHGGHCAERDRNRGWEWSVLRTPDIDEKISIEIGNSPRDEEQRGEER
jgi:hypothetical protein